MHCRRCLSLKVLRLKKGNPNDHDVYRCRDCGFLFSPAESSTVPSRSSTGA